MKIYILIILMLASSFSSIAGAEEESFIGVIDWRGAIFSTKEAKKENNKIQKEFKKDTQKLKSLESRISSNRKKLEKSNELLNDEQKEKLLVDLQNDVLEYQTLRQEVEQKIQKKEQDFVEKYTKSMKKIVERIAKEKGLHVILPVDAVIYGRLTIDITDEVVKELNKKKS